MSAVPPFDPEAAGPGYLWTAVADHLAARIERGDLKPGGRLPAERDLASEYGVSIMTTRHAVRVLRDRGLLVTFASKGTFVTRPRPKNG